MRLVAFCTQDTRLAAGEEAVRLSTVTFLKRLLQKVAIISAEELPATSLLQKLSNASLSALWNMELLPKHVAT